MDDPGLTIAVEDEPRREDVAVVGQGLDAFNRSVLGAGDDHRLLAVFLRDADGAVVGGAVGATWWRWLHVDLLWVDERLRRRGHGARLLAAAEEEAARRGCAYAYLDTHSFQAPSFYEWAGYAIFGELPDFPPGHRRIFLAKRLGNPGAAPD